MWSDIHCNQLNRVGANFIPLNSYGTKAYKIIIQRLIVFLKQQEDYFKTFFVLKGASKSSHFGPIGGSLCAIYYL